MRERHHLIDLHQDNLGFWWQCHCSITDLGSRGPFDFIEERDQSIEAHMSWHKVGPIPDGVEPIHPDWDPLYNPNPTEHKADS